MPLPVAVGYVTVGLVAGLLALIRTGPQAFAPGVCERLEPYLESQVVGQGLALRQLCDAVCDHVSNANPNKPLVLSVHGPPGVGKSMVHQLAARALYNREPSADTQCPGIDCPGYKVLYGMDYLRSEREQQHALLRAALMEHISAHPEALIVIEEYDKLDCATRGFFRQLLENARTANVTLDRSIVLLESNAGYLQLHELLQSAGSRDKISAEEAQKVLKDLVFSLWSADDCEERTDTLKMLALVDFFLPFLPLERPHIEELFEMRLRERRHMLTTKQQAANLTWTPELVRFLTDRVDFEGAYPIEGAKEVGTLMTRHVSRALRPWSGQLGADPPHERMKTAITQAAEKVKKAVGKSTNATAGRQKALQPALPHLQLSIGADLWGVKQVVVHDAGKGSAA